MTETGQNLTKITQGMIWVTESRPLWANASTDFASGVSGEINVFHSSNGVKLDSIWREFEYPTLQNNPNVTGINYHVVMPDGTTVKIK